MKKEAVTTCKVVFLVLNEIVSRGTSCNKARSLMIDRLTCTFGNPDFFNHFLNFRGWGRGQGTYDKGDYKIDRHTEKPNSFRGDTKPKFFAFSQELEVDNIT